MSLINFKKKLENFKKNKYQRSIFNYNDFIIREKIKKKLYILKKKKFHFIISAILVFFSKMNLKTKIRF